MGWGSGSRLMGGIIDALNAEIDDMDTRRRIYKAIIPCFEDMDCDTLDECCDDLIFLHAYAELNPDEFEWDKDGCLVFENDEDIDGDYNQ